MVVGMIIALAGCSPSAPQHFGDADSLVSFDYPAGWHARVAECIDPSGNFPIAFVGSADLPSECSSNPGGVAASGGAVFVVTPWPVTELAPGGVVVAWRFVGMDGAGPPSGGGASILVGGRSAFRTSGPADPDCAAIGGDESIDLSVPAMSGENHGFTADACLAGPDLVDNERAFSAILASTTFPPPTSTSPTP